MAKEMEEIHKRVPGDGVTSSGAGRTILSSGGPRVGGGRSRGKEGVM